MSLMTEPAYQKLADATLRRVEDMFKDVDSDDADYDRSGDVLTFTFRDGTKCVLNTQRPTRQLWLAASARAWHFGYDEATCTWLDDKGLGVELFAKLGEIAKTHAGIVLVLVLAREGTEEPSSSSSSGKTL